MMAKDMGMTTNLVECMNFVLKGACVLPIIVLAGHDYPEELAVMLQENCCRAEMHNVYVKVQELANPQLGRQTMTHTIKLNEWWYDCVDFQALRLPCSHIIVVDSSCTYILTCLLIPCTSCKTFTRLMNFNFTRP
ncbi:hypothetical protein GmHk_15G043828 [Glycine max]|nr:hypothetical protein GmHk_15G043828 [Glycine max]